MRDSNATVGKNLLPSSMRKSWLRSDTDEPMRLTDVLTRGPLHSGFRVLSRAIPFDRLQVTLIGNPQRDSRQHSVACNRSSTGAAAYSHRQNLRNVVGGDLHSFFWHHSYGTEPRLLKHFAFLLALRFNFPVRTPQLKSYYGYPHRDGRQVINRRLGSDQRFRRVKDGQSSRQGLARERRHSSSRWNTRHS
jgi:hypothetical protein